MNVYVADQMAREHADRMMADAALARRVHAARANRRQAKRVTMTVARGRPTSRARAAVSRAVTRPYSAFHAWLSAGLL
jgi:hypothetical protein